MKRSLTAGRAARSLTVSCGPVSTDVITLKDKVMAGAALVFALALAALLTTGGFATAALAGISYLLDGRPRGCRRCDTAPAIIARVRADVLDRADGRHAASNPQKLPGGQGGCPAHALPAGSPHSVRGGAHRLNPPRSSAAFRMAA